MISVEVPVARRIPRGGDAARHSPLRVRSLSI